jgi:Flp pilus assembly protein TadD
VKDPTAWMDDLNVYLDDETMSSMAAQQEPTANFPGSKLGVGLWTAVVGTLAGALGAVTLSPDVRTVPGFAAYLFAAFLLLRGLRPATDRLFGRGIAWLAFTAVFWGFLLGLTAAVAGRVGSLTLGTGIALTGGFFVGLIAGSLGPPFVKHEHGWMAFSIIVAPASVLMGTALIRGPYGGSGAAEGLLLGGALGAGGYIVATSGLMVALWDEAYGYYRVALLFLHNDNFAAKAAAYLDRAIARSPRDPVYYNLRGIAWSKLGNPDAARADWAKVAELLPDDPDPLLNQSADFMRNGQVDEAIAVLERLLRTHETHARAHSNLGSALERKGEIDAALRHYDRAIALQPDYPNALSNRSYAWFRKGDYPRAIADADEAIRLDERLAMAHVNRGHALGAMGESHGAVASYRAALMLDPAPEVREEAMQGLERLRPAGDRAGDADEGAEPA